MGKGPNGLTICSCGCGREVQPPRRSWFSDACVHEWKIRNWPPYARDQVEKRDRGVCAECGIDTEALKAPLRPPHGIEQPDEWKIAFALGHESPHLPQEPQRCWRLDLKPDVKAAVDVAMWIYEEAWAAVRSEIQDHKDWMRRNGWPVDRHLWEADHIKPVIEGGGQCGLENLRTLCLRCHRRATAELARRRALARRGQKDAASGQTQLLELSMP